VIDSILICFVDFSLVFIVSLFQPHSNSYRVATERHGRSLASCPVLGKQR